MGFILLLGDLVVLTMMLAGCDEIPTQAAAMSNDDMNASSSPTLVREQNTSHHVSHGKKAREKSTRARNPRRVNSIVSSGSSYQVQSGGRLSETGKKQLGGCQEIYGDLHAESRYLKESTQSCCRAETNAASKQPAGLSQ